MRAIYQPTKAAIINPFPPVSKAYADVPDKCALVWHRQAFGIRLEDGKPYIARLVDAKWYTTKHTTRTSKYYCRVQVKEHGVLWGRAGGYGVNKTSESFADALYGVISLYEDDNDEPGSVAGCGEAPVLQAMHAIAVSMFPDAKCISHFG